MEKHQPVIVYTAIFLLVAIVLKMLGIINVSSLELLSFLFIIFGVSYVFLSFGNNRKGLLFTATCIFLIGVLIYLFNNFEFFAPSRLIYPSLLFIAGIGFLMIYLDGDLPRTYLFIAIGLTLVGLLLTILKGHFGISFFPSLVSVVGKYWIIIALTIIVFLLMSFQERRRK